MASLQTELFLSAPFLSRQSVLMRGEHAVDTDDDDLKQFNSAAAKAVHARCLKLYRRIQRLSTERSSLDTRGACLSMFNTLFSLERFATGTPYAPALRAARMAVRRHRDAPPSDKKKKTLPSDRSAMCVLAPRDAPSFGGPFWDSVPEFHLWLSTLDIATGSFHALLTELYDDAYTVLCADRIHPAICATARAVVRVAISRYVRALASLKCALDTWRRTEDELTHGKYAAEARFLRLSAASEFWKTVDTWCVISARTDEVMLDIGAAPDIVECSVLPALAQTGIMTPTYGTRSFRVSGQQTGVADLPMLTCTDAQSVGLRLCPERVLFHAAFVTGRKSSNAPLLDEIATLTRFGDWVRVRRAIDVSRHASERLYPPL